MASEPEHRYQLRDLEEALQKSPADLAAFLSDTHPADVAEWLEELEDDDARRVLGALPVELQAEVLSFTDDWRVGELLTLIEVPQLVEIVEELPADEVVDLLARTEDAKSEEVLRQVDLERAKGLRELLAYDEESAGGVMTTDFVTVPLDISVGDAIKEIRSEEGPASEEEVGVFVVDKAGRPVGFVSDRDLITTPIHTPIEEVMEKDLIVSKAGDDQEEAAHQLAKYNLSALPVVDETGVLIGVISAEDAHEVLQDEVEEDLYRLVGTSIEDPTRVSVLHRVRHRLPLLALTMCGGLVTASILYFALGSTGSSGSGRTADILRFLPIIIALAGNVGVQSSTILVRGFATGEISPDRGAAVVWAEVLTGLVIGGICGAATMIAAAYMEGGGLSGLQFGASVGVAIVVAVTWASFLGCTVPTLCQRWGIDPAIVAGPFLITLSDISGSAIFVTVAALMAVTTAH